MSFWKNYESWGAQSAPRQTAVPMTRSTTMTRTAPTVTPPIAGGAPSFNTGPVTMVRPSQSGFYTKPKTPGSSGGGGGGWMPGRPGSMWDTKGGSGGAPLPSASAPSTVIDVTPDSGASSLAPSTGGGGGGGSSFAPAGGGGGGGEEAAVVPTGRPLWMYVAIAALMLGGAYYGYRYYKRRKKKE